MASRLFQYMVLDWVKADDQSFSDDENVTIGQQYIFDDAVTKSLTFSPLTWRHCTEYICEAKLLLPDPAGSFNTSLQYHLNTLSASLTTMCMHTL